MFFKFMGLFNQTPFHVKMNINAQYLLIYTYMFHAVKSIESI